MYYLTQPPFFLLFVGLFTGVSCGLAFEATLKNQVQQWRIQLNKGKKAQLSEASSLRLPFIGICIGICLFLAAGLEIFSYNRTLAYGLAFPLTLFIGSLVWAQLSKLIMQLLEGGSKALDLDAY